MFASLKQALPVLDRLAGIPLAGDHAMIWAALERLMRSNAPRTGCVLPNGIADVIAAIAGEAGLGDRFIRDFANTGNSAIEIGADKAQPDIVIVAHMDRPSFRVRDSREGEIYPVCALRLPEGGYTCDAKALRYSAEARGLIVASTGRFHGEGKTLHYHTSGEIAWNDTIVMEAEPTLTGGTIVGTGLDNCLGVISALGAAAVLHVEESALIQADRKVLFVFSDEEEGIPEVFFGHGAGRLSQVISPSIGAIIADAHTAGPGLLPVLGRGACHGVITAWGRGSLVAPNYTALAGDLAAEFAGRVQINSGYLSRSDDMGMSRWTRILGMIGVPMQNAHTAHESAQLSDIPHTLMWMATFIAACLRLAPSITEAYALDR